MSNFQELIKNFSKTRDYVRDFFVYGFKTRNDFNNKSARTYDNERRRLESWLSPYIRRDYTSNGANISLAIDSNLLDTNPLFQVWKTKCFTDNDIVLHFLIIDLLNNNKTLTADEITDNLLTKYNAFFDIQTVRRKCNKYTNDGLLTKEKLGKKVLYSIDNSLALWIKTNENIHNALAFYQMAGDFGIIANVLSEQLDIENNTFRVKHNFFVHTLEDEILIELLNCINKKLNVQLQIKSSKAGTLNTSNCTPLQIFTSTRSGRRFLCGYVHKNRRFTCFRLDTIKQVFPMEKYNEYDELLTLLNKNRSYIWGVSFQSETGNHLEKLTMILHVNEPFEHFIIERLKREGRGGIISKTAPDTYKYEIEVFDCNEMLPWIRTFIGRIISLECTSEIVKKRFYNDLNTMYKMYGINTRRQ